MKLLKILFLSFIFLLFSYHAVAAKGTDQFITIVNPVRIAYYTKDVSQNIYAQYDVIKRNNLPATWLLTYDVLLDGKATRIIRLMDDKQEAGIFVEISPALASAAGVTYHETGSWHFANAVFLSGYTQDERRKLIDTVFDKFKSEFGYYPTSVGSWWTDAFSMDYMKQKYGIEANLTCSDQFSTDGYQLWGTPWSVAYYPSKLNSGIPASDVSVKQDIVNMQWAPRDPVNGYTSSMYSTQDYGVIGLNFDYFKKLVDIYGRKNNNPFGQITIGLEGDLDPGVYNGEYSKQIAYVKGLVDKGEFSAVTMSQFGDWYKKTFPDLSPSMIINTNDPLGANKKVIWYQSPNYRIGVSSDASGNNAEIFDFRIYNKDLSEPYYISPNYDKKLSINIPYFFDKFENGSEWKLGINTDATHFYDNKIVIDKFFWNIPGILSKGEGLSVKRFLNRTEILFKNKWLSPPMGEVVKDFSAEAAHLFRTKKFWLALLTGHGWNNFQKVSYLLPQGEVDALFYLSSLTSGKVMVYDHECLQCSFHTNFPPPAFSNKRSYVKVFGKHDIVYNSSIFEATNRADAKNTLKKLGVKYVYLVKFEDYTEKLPFSPGDLGVKKIYSNANAEIWEVEK